MRRTNLMLRRSTKVVSINEKRQLLAFVPMQMPTFAEIQPSAWSVTHSYVIEQHLVKPKTATRIVGMVIFVIVEYLVHLIGDE